MRKMQEDQDSQQSQQSLEPSPQSGGAPDSSPGSGADAQSGKKPKKGIFSKLKMGNPFKKKQKAQPAMMRPQQQQDPDGSGYIQPTGSPGAQQPADLSQYYYYYATDQATGEMILDTNGQPVVYYYTQEQMLQMQQSTAAAHAANANNQDPASSQSMSSGYGSAGGAAAGGVDGHAGGGAGSDPTSSSELDDVYRSNANNNNVDNIDDLRVPGGGRVHPHASAGAKSSAGGKSPHAKNPLNRGTSRGGDVTPPATLEPQQ